MPLPVGTCYEDAWRFLIKEGEGELIHGSVQNIGKRINHAWVELPTGYVWEPESGEFMKKSYFYERAEPIVEHSYSATEAAIMLARVGKHGPWSEEERQMLKRGNPVAKEPWQMTQAEYSQWASSLEKRYNEILGKPVDPQSPVGREAEQRAFSQLKKETGLTQLTFTDMAGWGHWAKVRLAIEEGKPVPPEVLADYPDLQKSNPGRVKFDRGSLDSAIAAASRLKSDRNLYVFATHLGYTIDGRPPPGMQQYVIVHPDGTTETIKPGGNPANTWICPKCGRINLVYPYPTRCSHCGYLRETTEKVDNPMPKVRRQGEWIYVRVGDTEMRGRPDPSGIEIEQVSPTYKKDEVQEAVDTIEGMLKKGGNPITETDMARVLAIIDSRPKGRIIESKLREEFGDAVIDALRQGRYIVAGSAGYNPPLLVSLKGRELIQKAEGGNPMRTESERQSFHERIFGKGSIPPLERLGRGQTVNDLLPMPPDQGPPLPRVLALRWPWSKP